MKKHLFLIIYLVSVLLFAAPVMADDAKANLFSLSYAEVEEVVGRALAEKGVAPKVAATINGRKNEPIFSYSRPLAVELRGLRLEKDTGHWSANLLMVSENEVISAMPASGRYDELAEVPVLKRPIRNGQVIALQDIEVRDIPMAQARYDVVTDIASLVGKSPAQSISAFRPIRSHEIQMPDVVKKNSIVHMHYTAPGMQISTTGQAIESGAKGAVIGVRNLASKKIIQAVVDDEANVHIQAPVAGRTPVTREGDIYAKN